MKLNVVEDSLIHAGHVVINKTANSITVKELVNCNNDKNQYNTLFKFDSNSKYTQILIDPSNEHMINIMVGRYHIDVIQIKFEKLTFINISLDVDTSSASIFNNSVIVTYKYSVSFNDTCNIKCYISSEIPIAFIDPVF